MLSIASYNNYKLFPQNIITNQSVPQNNTQNSYHISDNTLWESKKSITFGIGLKNIMCFNPIRKEVKKLEAEAKLLGVNADYACYLEQGKQINKAMLMAKEAGYLLPDNISCTEAPFKGNKTSGGRQEFVMPTKKNLQDEEIMDYFLNAKSRVYIRPITPEETMKKNKTNLSDILFVTLHEIGHLNHKKSCVMANDITTLRFSNRCLAGFKGYDKIAEELGCHSVSDGHEFIANVFAKKVGGEEISKQVNKAYDLWSNGHLKPFYFDKKAAK
jgi:hypothetical protein